MELALVPPIRLDVMLPIHKRLKETENVTVLNMGGSVDRGITIRVSAKTPTPLIKIIREMLGVEKVWEEIPGIISPVPGRQGQEEQPIRRIIINTK